MQLKAQHLYLKLKLFEWNQANTYTTHVLHGSTHVSQQIRTIAVAATAPHMTAKSSVFTNAACDRDEKQNKIGNPVDAVSNRNQYMKYAKDQDGFATLPS